MTLSWAVVAFTGSDDEVSGVLDDVMAGAVGLSIREAYNGPVRHGLPFPSELGTSWSWRSPRCPPGTSLGES